MRSFYAVVLAFLSLPAFAELSVTYEASQVVVRGLAEGSDLAYLRVEEWPQNWTMVRRVDRDVVVDDDADGEVSIKLESSPTQGIFVAVDMRTGAIAYGSPAEVEVDVRELPTGRIRRGNSGGFSDLDWGWGEIEALWLRRGSGVWWLRGADGSDTDSDGLADNKQRLSFSRAQRLERDRTPGSAQVSDRLMVIDLDQMTLSIWVEADPSNEGGAQ